ncbi:MAG: WD40 repeat domain-containing protein, partial [Chlorogloeopsis fritschii C42_A2020_084]|uniref:WD40 repeat domain-containing protein n=1 Tax=Chlorogloeopsis fritschii TaxID=1124 RepID=UPI0019DAF222
MPQTFVITGQVEFSGDANLLLGGRVEAYDRDLPSLEQRGKAPQLLGQSPINDQTFQFRIEFTDEQFRQTGNGSIGLRQPSKINPNLSFKVFDATGREQTITGILLQGGGDPVQIIFNAPSNLEAITIQVAPIPEVTISKYERLIALITPVIASIPLAELTDADVTFLVNQQGERFEGEPLQDQIEWLRRSASLTQQTNLPIEAFYAWGHKISIADSPNDLPSVLRGLLTCEDTELSQTLQVAIADNIIPAQFGDRIPQILAQIERVRVNQGLLVARQFVGKLLNERTREPLFGFRVQVFDLDAGDQPKQLGQAFSNDQGVFSLTYITPPTPTEATAEQRQRRLRLEVYINSQNQDKFELEVQAGADQDVQDVPVTLPAPQEILIEQLPGLSRIEPASGLSTVARLTAAPEPATSSDLIAFLQDQNITTLEALRNAGGIRQLENLPSDVDEAQIELVETHTELYPLTNNVENSAALIDRGYSSLTQIARTSQSDFVNDLRDRADDINAAELHAVAHAQTAYLNNLRFREAGDRANGLETRSLGSENIRCTCQACESAVSPLAYLTDLLKFATTDKNIKKFDPGNPDASATEITAANLTEILHQPFDSLRASCEAVDTPVRQVRLCIEVLRGYLKANPLADASKLATAEKQYLLAAYTSLLTKLGTSFSEIRLARNSEPGLRQSLADRLGINISHVNALFLDPNPTEELEAPASKPLTEARLEELLGLVDTTRNPLSEGVKLGDAELNQITSWNLNNVQPGINSDQEGKVYVKLGKVPNLEGHEDVVRSVAFSRDGQLIVSGSVDQTVRLWDAQTRQQIGESLQGHNSPVYSVAFSPDGSRIVSGGGDNKLRVWDTQTRQQVGELTGHEAAVLSVAFSLDGQRIVSSGLDKKLRLWDAQSLQLIAVSLEEHDDTVTSVAFSPDGNRIVSGSADQKLRLWVAQSLQPIGVPLEGHNTVVWSVAFSPDGQRIVSGGFKTLRLWDAQTGQTIRELQGHDSTVLSVAFSPDGQRLVSGGYDKTLRLWDVQTGQAIGRPLEGHEAPVWSVMFSRDGNRIVSGSEDKTVRLWNAQTRRPSTGVVRVELYQDKPLQDGSFEAQNLVASGDISKNSGTIKLLPENKSGLYGVFDVVYVADSTSISIAAIPEFLNWRLQHLRTLWKAQDWTTDAYEESQSAVTLKQLPANITLTSPGNTFPAPLATISYDRDRQQLIRTAGVITLEEKQGLLALSSDEGFQQAVKQLFQASQRLPIIDPDLVGLDDFRNPTPSDRAFKLWQKRSEWVISRLEALAALPKTSNGAPSITELFTDMSKTVYYSVNDSLVSIIAWSQNTFSDLVALRVQLNDGEVNQVKLRLQDEFNLTVESFTRLMAIADKTQAWENDQREEIVSEQEWQEVYSILVQVLKMKLFATWRQEEKDAQIQLGPESFWLSLTQPQEGDWPQALSTTEPTIDPSALKLKDLPDAVVGEQAIKLWNDRQKVVIQIPDVLETKRKADGFEPMLAQALGEPLSALDAIKDNLSNPDSAESATKKIESLNLTVEGFKRLMGIRAKVGTNNEPTRAEWAEVYTILAKPYEIKVLYPTWKEQETSGGTRLPYWQVLKAKLPRWRASNESRQVWLQALLDRSQPPLIDPDLIDPGDFKNSVLGDRAFKLWKSREEAIGRQLTSLKEQSKDLTGLDKCFQSTLSISKDDFLKVAATQVRGEIIADRLVQLSLEFTEFNYLLRVVRILQQGEKILNSEWENVNSILVQVWKRRQAGKWRSEEREEGVFRSPDFFQVQFQDTPTNLPGEVDPKEIWRSPRLAYLDWQEQLQTRIDQEQQTIQAYRTVIGAAEEETLEQLRDALVLAIDVQGGLEAKAKWATENLLIDAKTSSSITTTRVAQAIETLQTLFLALRTGKLEEQFKDLKLRDLEKYNQAWKVLGSYTSWRATMFVFLYPENLLLPSLLTLQTPAFESLLTNSKSKQKLFIDDIKQLVDEYSKYIKDIRYLEVAASCLAVDKLGNNIFNSLYTFGISNTGTVYWSVCDFYDNSGFAQKLWLPVKASNGEKIKNWDNIIEIIGAVPYAIDDRKRYIYLFALRANGDTVDLLYLKYDNDNRIWLNEAQVLDINIPPISVPDEDAWNKTPTSLRVILKQRDSNNEPPQLAFSVSVSRNIMTTHTYFYVRRLNSKGDGWEDGEFRSFGPPSQYEELRGMLASYENENYVYVFRADVQASFTFLDVYINIPPDLLPIGSPGPTYTLPATYRGAFSIPG